MTNDPMSIKGCVVVVLTDVRTRLKKTYESHNIVGNAGDIWYCQKVVAEAVTNDFAVMELGTAGNTPTKTSDRSDMTSKVASSEKAFSSGYPKRNDGDGDNTGAGTDVVTFLSEWTTAEVNVADIDRVIITIASPGASEALLMYGEFDAAITKTSSQTLKVFVNHTFTGE